MVFSFPFYCIPFPARCAGFHQVRRIKVKYSFLVPVAIPVYDFFIMPTYKGNPVNRLADLLYYFGVKIIYNNLTAFNQGGNIAGSGHTFNKYLALWDL